jgi:hypothetical protein
MYWRLQILCHPNSDAGCGPFKVHKSDLSFCGCGSARKQGNGRHWVNFQFQATEHYQLFSPVPTSYHCTIIRTEQTVTLQQPNLASCFLLFLFTWTYYNPLSVLRLVTTFCFPALLEHLSVSSRADTIYFLSSRKRNTACFRKRSAPRIGLSRLDHPLVSFLEITICLRFVSSHFTYRPLKCNRYNTVNNTSRT